MQQGMGRSVAKGLLQIRVVHRLSSARGVGPGADVAPSLRDDVPAAQPAILAEPQWCGGPCARGSCACGPCACVALTERLLQQRSPTKYD